MPHGRRTVSPTVGVTEVEQMFDTEPELSSVIVAHESGPVCLTRLHFFAELTGRLGFGYALYARRTLADLPCPPTLVLPAATDIAEAAQAVLERPARLRYEDILVAFEDGSHGTVAVADLFAEQARTHAFDALHDGLTGLANRRLFVARLRSARKEPAIPCAVLFLDVDEFKSINDSLGHDVGNQALVEVAARLREVIGKLGTVARLGGDEFGVLLDRPESRPAVLAIVEQLVCELRRPLSLAHTTIPLSASVGAAVALDGESASYEEMLRDADLAMYAAKRYRKSGWAFYEPGMEDQARAGLEIRAQLDGALERDEFQLHYQPIVELGGNRIVGLEALLRWWRPGGGLVAPDQFIPVCERTGLIVPIGRWVLHEACRQAAAWSVCRAEAQPLRMSVNLSPVQLHDPSLVADVADALSASGLPPSSLVLEITEGVLIRDTDTVLGCLSELKALGVRIALDDFGAGFSSLRYLANLPIDVLKLDRAFVGPVEDRGKRRLVSGILSLAGSLGLTTVAEGVETAAQAQHLIAADCSFAQGFHFARPQDADQIDQLLSGDRGARAGTERTTPVP